MEVAAEYKQTEVGLIPENWNVKLLPEVSHFRGGKAHEQYISETGRFICVNSKFISTDGRVRKYSTANFCSAKENDVLMVMSDLPNGKALAKTYIVDRADLYAVNQRVCALSAYSDYSSKYFFYILNRNPYFLKFDDGVSQTHLLNDVFRKCPLPFPPTKTEQEAIAKALSDADALIESLEQLIAKKRHIKQGAMQELLIGKRRLPEFETKSGYKQTEIGVIPEDWNAVPLSDLGQFKNGLNKGKEAFGHGSPFVNLMDVFGVSCIWSIDTLGLVDSNTVEQQTYDLRAGDVIFIRSSVKPSGVGLTAVIEINLPNTVYSGFLIRFRDDGMLDSGFKRHCFYEEGFRKRVIAASSVSANTNINQNNLNRLLLPVPSTKAEQEAIANILSVMDAEIIALETKLTKARHIKQGMMQKLLTGRIRLV